MRRYALPAALLLAVIAAGVAAPPPERLTALLADYDALRANDHRRETLLREIDAVAGQKDAVRSRLFWHTDLAQALAVAKTENKPVLSLRLLGRLDEELSCANSRYFRQSLYTDRKVIAALQLNYVLHWESLRPVPVITIDFGDGRQIKRTITGNSIHYVLAPDGVVLDALPGLYDAKTFSDELTEIAIAARAVSPDQRNDQRQRLAYQIKMSGKPQPERRLTDAERAAPVAFVKRAEEELTMRSVRNPSDNVAADTWQNQRLFRPQILQWLSEGLDRDLPTLNRRVYAQLFRTPLDDPMMGLREPDAASLLYAPSNAVPPALQAQRGGGSR